MVDLDVMVSSQGHWSYTNWGQQWSGSNSDCGGNWSHWRERSRHGSEWVESCEGCWSCSNWSWRCWWWGQGEGERSRGRTEELPGLPGFVLFPPDDPPLASPLTSRHLVPHHLPTVATHSDDVAEAGGGGLGQAGHHRQAEQHELKGGNISVKTGEKNDSSSSRQHPPTASQQSQTYFDPELH